MTNIHENFYKILSFSKNFHGEDFSFDGSYNYSTGIGCKLEEQQYSKENIFYEIKEEEKHEKNNNNLNYYPNSMEVQPSDQELFNYDMFSFLNDNSLSLAIILNEKKKEENQVGGGGGDDDDDDDQDKKIISIKKSKGKTYQKSGNFKIVKFTADIFRLKQSDAAKSLNISISCINRLLKEEIVKIPTLREKYFKNGKRCIIWPHRNCSKSPLVHHAIQNNGICIKYRNYKKGN
ncbi:hypothetical protein ACTFIZ_006136 [Dictyostelium cf. discoideum]